MLAASIWKSTLSLNDFITLFIFNLGSRENELSVENFCQSRRITLQELNSVQLIIS